MKSPVCSEREEAFFPEMQEAGRQHMGRSPVSVLTHTNITKIIIKLMLNQPVISFEESYHESSLCFDSKDTTFISIRFNGTQFLDLDFPSSWTESIVL